MAKRVTVYDIAERVGLSTSTVSRVLNNSILISRENRELILTTAAEMGYRKRSIRKHRNRAILNIALFLPNLQARHLHLFYEITELIQTIRGGFGETRVNIISDLFETAPDHLGFKKVGGIDGAIFAFCDPPAADLQLFRELEIPFCLLNRNGSGFDYVDCDQSEGTRRLLQEILRRRPHARPCYFDFTPIAVISNRRKEGFLQGCRQAGIGDLKKRIITVDRFADLTEEKLLALREEYDAFVAFNDVLALYIYQLALGTGLRIPEDAALTGFDGSPVTGLISLQLTTMVMPLQLMVAEAARWLYRKIIERDEEDLKLTLTAKLISGQTV